MKSIQKKFLFLLNTALRGEKCNLDALSYTELCHLQKLAHIHHLDALIFSAFDNLDFLRSHYLDLINAWEKTTVFSALKQKMNYIHLEQILQTLLAANISVIPLKGVYLRELYPQPDFRTMGDADLLIHGEDYEKVKELLLSLDYTEVPDHHPYHSAFTKPKFPCIEIHWALTNGQSFNAIAIEAFQNQVWEHAILASVASLQTLSFSHEDSCIYLVIHMAKHLKYTGFGLRQVCDLYLLLNTYCTSLDWYYVSNTLKEMGLYPFFSLMLTTIHTLFDFPLSTIPLNDLPNFHHTVTSFFINELFQSGTFGNGSYSHSMSSLLINGEKNISKNHPTKVKDFLFPSKSKLQIQYPYCKKCLLLIPVAWIHHLFNLCFRQDVSFYSKVQALLFSNHNKKKRMQLFKSLDL